MSADFGSTIDLTGLSGAVFRGVMVLFFLVWFYRAVIPTASYFHRHISLRCINNVKNYSFLMIRLNALFYLYIESSPVDSYFLFIVTSSNVIIPYSRAIPTKNSTCSSITRNPPEYFLPEGISQSPSSLLVLSFLVLSLSDTL